MRPSAFVLSVVFLSLAAAGTASAIKPTISAAPPTIWYLTDDAHPAIAGAFIMTTTQPQGGGDVTADGGDCIVWAAETAAPFDSPFQGTGWGGEIQETAANRVVLTYDSDLGSSAALPTLPLDGQTDFASGPASQGAFSASGAGFTVLTGDYLAFLYCIPIENADDKNPPDVRIHTQNSFISNGESLPYPTPELPVLPLTMLGLAVVGMVALRRRF